MDSVSTQLESLMVLGIAMMEVMNEKVILHLEMFSCMECLHSQLIWVYLKMVFTIFSIDTCLDIILCYDHYRIYNSGFFVCYEMCCK